MQAIVELNGKQYKVENSRYVDVDHLSYDLDHEFEVDRVLMVIDGAAIQVGKPYVSGVTVKAKVLRHGRDKKIRVFKMRPKKGYRRTHGHRQDFTRIQISIG